MNDKIRVLHILPSLGKGGAERLVLDICNGLMKYSDFEVKLITFNAENEYKDITASIDWEICPCKYVPSITGKAIVETENFKKLISEYKPAIIHSHLFESEIISRSIIYNEIAYITHLHDNMKQFRNFSFKTLFNKELLTNYYEKLLMIKKYRQCKNSFIAISNDTKDYFTNCLPPDMRNITLIPNAIWYDKFYNPDIKSISKDEVTRLISIGSLVDKKNHIFLIDVVKILKDKGYNIFLNILGDGINRKIIEEKINRYALNNIVSLRGNVNNVQEYLKSSSIYVHSATYEPFGLVLPEAMASGLPCITLDGKGNRDIINEGLNGYILKEQNPELFAGKIITLINNPELYLKMSNYSKEFSKKFDIKDYIIRLSEYYCDVIEKLKR